MHSKCTTYPCSTVLWWNWQGTTIKQDMTVGNQGHIFQSGDQTTTCIFTALLDLDGSQVRADPLFSMQITEYYIDCLICLKSI